jgi:hypothetical protein
VEAKRKLLLIISVIGMVGTFLPWAKWGPLTVSGAKGDGWFTFVFFGIAAAFCLFKGPRNEPLAKGSMTAVSAMGILGFLFGLWKIIRFNDVSASGLTLGIGLWVITLAGAAIIYFNFFKKKAAVVGAPTEPVIAAGPTPVPAPEPIAEPIVVAPPAPAPAAPAPYGEPAAPPEEPEEENEPEF